MPTYAPGSFTKNFGWDQHPPGFARLYTAIRAGFAGQIVPVLRDTFRNRCGIPNKSIQLIPINFFLHNTIVSGQNYVSIDELVRHALYNPHSRRFDRLALFSLNLARMGRRLGVNGDPKGAAYANEFVKGRLWEAGGWQKSRLSDSEIESSFRTTVNAKTPVTLHKCVTNYFHLLEEVSGFGRSNSEIINTNADEWVGPGLFLAFDRFWLDRGAPPSRADLLAMVAADELHKLIGISQSTLDASVGLFIDEYLDLGALNRVSEPAVVTSAGEIVVSSAVSAPRRARQASSQWTPGAAGASWSDQDAEDAATVMRRLQEVQAQIRNARHVRELKALYQHTCVFCGKQMIVGVDPDKHYSEAAHIRPVGEPYNGPDQKNNMIILCPEHHLQFDRGVLRLRESGGNSVIRSKITGDALHDRPINLKHPHTIGVAYVQWHYDYWR